jgi:tryptophanyl-tRNA synthetase
VGEDQVSHVETSREIVRRFNTFYGFELDFSINNTDSLGHVGFIRGKLGLPAEELQAPRNIGGALVPIHHSDIEPAARRRAQQVGWENFIREMGESSRFFHCVQKLTEPEAMLTKTPRIPGLDGRKMSKSYGNAITLSESDADIRVKTKVMKTDPARQRRTDPGNPDVCPVYDWHKLFSPPETLEWAAAGCRSAGIGCIECKAKMADHLIAWIAPVRERRVEYEKHPRRVLEVLDEGSYQARKVAQQTMIRVREAVFGWNRKREEIHARFTEVHDTHG